MTAEPAIVTRFAPSPTGYLHIGGARTALFNWLYARGRGGRFLLRIEDTDRARHSEEAVQAILEGLAWLGLDYDGEPISQFARRERHAEAAAELLARGAAYRCYCTPEELDALRAEAKSEGRPLRSPWRDRSAAEAPAGAPFVVRFRAPDEGETVVPDAVQGDVSIQNRQLDDMVLLRSDGSPTYTLAVVVDERDMQVTHVIRGDDHLTNAARQTQLFEALDWPAPRYAHIPLIHGPDGAKLSKRHGALGVEAYREMGYLPAGLRNYLLRLGWSHGDDEFITDAQARDWFDLTAIGRAPARLDLDKLASVNAFHLRALPDERLIAVATPFVEAMVGAPLDADSQQRLVRAAGALKERAQTLRDVADAAKYLFVPRPVEPDGKAAKALAKPGAAETVARLAAALSRADDWTVEGLETALEAFVAAEGGSFGKVGPPARAALTGGAPAPSLAETMFALGRDETLARLADQANAA